MVDQAKLARLDGIACELRRLIVEMMGADRPHHFGGSLSAVELITGLYFYKMRYDPSHPHWEARDRFIMSKGHAVPAQYAALALLGVIPRDQLRTLKQLGSLLQGHPNAHLTPGIEAFTGSLGQGLSFGNGVAMAARLRGLESRVYVLLGDGELHEGQVWEAALGATAQRLDSLVALVDRNGLKSQGPVDEAKPLDPIAAKWQAFGWHTIEVDGHDLRQVCDALDAAEAIRGQPTAVIARTVKGKGVSFMEGRFEFHNAPITSTQWELAMEELGRRAEEER